MIVMGNFKIGKGKMEDIRGEFRIGTRNDGRYRWSQFYQNQDLIIINTYFKFPERSFYTWKSPADS